MTSLRPELEDDTAGADAGDDEGVGGAAETACVCTVINFVVDFPDAAVAPTASLNPHQPSTARTELAELDIVVTSLARLRPFG